jgi:hypothetical protein
MTPKSMTDCSILISTSIVFWRVSNWRSIFMTLASLNTLRTDTGPAADALGGQTCCLDSSLPNKFRKGGGANAISSTLDVTIIASIIFHLSEQYIVSV